MTEVEYVKYECDLCGKTHEKEEELVWISEISIAGDSYEDLHFCNLECLAKWVWGNMHAI